MTAKLREIYNFVEDKFDEKDFIAIDKFLKELDVEKRPLVELIGAIRVTSRAKAVLKEWQPTLRRIAKVVKQKEPDQYKAIMVGLTEFM